MIQLNTDLEKCSDIERPEETSPSNSYGSLMPVEIPPEELERSLRHFQGNECKQEAVSKSRKNRLLSDADGRKCSTCSTVMKHLIGIKFGHERPDAATLEHVNPRCLGGSNDDHNLAVRCNLCNRASGHVVNEWLQRHQYEPSWDERKNMTIYLWLEVYCVSMAEELFPDHFRSFITKRQSMQPKTEEEVRA